MIDMDMAQAHGRVGPKAETALAAYSDLRALAGIKPAKFSPDQRTTARLALLWAEQHLDGYIDAIGESDAKELQTASRQRQQIRSVRFEHFGRTALEVMSQKAVLVDAMSLLKGQVVSPRQGAAE